MSISPRLKWLKENKDKYQGQYVALIEDKLVYAHTDFAALLKYLNSIEEATVIQYISHE